MSASPETILSVDHVAVHFGGLIAISDMTFDVRRGEIVGLIGPNGAGKTTAFNVMTGFQRSTNGDVHYRGHILTGMKPHEIAKLGLVRTFQRTSVFRERSVFQNVLTGLHCSGRSSLWDSFLHSRREITSEQELDSKDVPESRQVSCRMASSASLALRSRLLQNRLCCCSTSQSPG